MKHLATIFTFLILSTIAFTQGEYNNWCFGNKIQLDFNSGSPIQKVTTLLSLGASSTISDRNGNLLFYANSAYVHNSIHTQMMNGAFFPNFATAQLQSVNILPFPCNDSLYYIFNLTTNSRNNINQSDLVYAIVNINANGGLGKVIQKNILLDSNVLGGFAMTRHANNKDYWIVYQKMDTNIYHAHQVSSTGIGSPITSSLGPNKTNWGGGDNGSLKFSTDAKQLINCGGSDFTTTCMNFSNLTGILSNYFNLNTPALLGINYPYASQFSPDLSKLYITTGSTIIQYDFSSGNASIIANSGIIVADYSSMHLTLSSFWDISLAPDQYIYIYIYIYISRASMPQLATINNPNDLGTACNFVNQSFNTNTTTGMGFPTMLPNLFVHRNVLTDSLFCQYDTVNLFLSNTNFIDSVLWNFGDAASGILNTSNDVVPLHVFNQYGLYPIEVIIYSGCVTDTVHDTIRINPTPIANLGNDTILCEGDSMQLIFNDTSFNYLWGTGDSSMQIQILQADTFTIAISSICGTAYDTIVIDSLIAALVHFPNDTLMCDTNKLFLDATIQNGTYIWNNGSVDSNLWADTAGTYYVTATNFCGVSSDTVVVTYTHTPFFDFGIDTALCVGDTLILNAWDTLSDFLWSTGDTFALDTLTTNGIYSVTTTNVCGAFSDTIELWFLTPPIAQLGNDTVICLGDSIPVSDTTLFGTYLWNTGLTTDSIWVNQAGTYSIRVSNICGFDSDTILVETDTIPIVDLGNDTVICVGNTINLNALFSRSTYLWSTGSADSTITASLENTYWATATNLCGTDIDSMYLDVDSILVLDLGPDSILCAGDSLLLQSNVVGASYAWNNGITSDNYLVLTNGLYALTVSNVCGSFGDSINVYYDNSPITNLGPDSTYCLATLVDLNAFWSRASYLWNTADTTANITANFSGNYSVQVTNLCGYDGDTVNIQYDIPIQFNLGNDTLLCVGDSFMLTAPAHNASWLWSTGGIDSLLIVNTAGTYSVQATNHCGLFTDEIQIRREVIPVIDPAILDTAFCEGLSYEVAVSPNNATSILWLNGSTAFQQSIDTSGWQSYALINACGLTSDTFHLEIQYPADAYLGSDTLICYGEEIIKIFDYPEHTYLWNNGYTDSIRYITEPGLYGVTIFTPVGCESYSQIEVASCDAQLFIPNAFTPGDMDELNKTFQIKGAGIKKFTIVIYDRWGMEVFRSMELNHSWDGTINGEPAASGIFSYKVWYNTGHTQNSVTMIGSVMLIR